MVALAEPLPKLTQKTKIKRKDIDKDYRTVRENGYATCWDEMEVGMGAIAVPIHLPDVGVIYSLGTAGLIDRLTRRPIIETVNLLRAALEPLIRTLRNRELTEERPDRITTISLPDDDALLATLSDVFTLHFPAGTRFL